LSGTTPQVANQLEGHGASQDYSFNKSHAAARAIAYRTAWLRAHHRASTWRR
jgi:DNA polymerase III alpha subunit